jgi:membrane protease subunit (stomatin/prohibitin family)
MISVSSFPRKLTPRTFIFEAASTARIAVRRKAVLNCAASRNDETRRKQIMALSLGVQAGSRLKIGSTMLQVLKILDGGRAISIKVNDHTYEVGNQRKIEVLPSVFVFCGVVGGWSSPTKSKLALDAPRSIQIARVDASQTGTKIASHE